MLQATTPRTSLENVQLIREAYEEDKKILSSKLRLSREANLFRIVFGDNASKGMIWPQSCPVENILSQETAELFPHLLSVYRIIWRSVTLPADFLTSQDVPRDTSLKRPNKHKFLSAYFQPRGRAEIVCLNGVRGWIALAISALTSYFVYFCNESNEVRVEPLFAVADPAEIPGLSPLGRYVCAGLRRLIIEKFRSIDEFAATYERLLEQGMNYIVRIDSDIFEGALPILQEANDKGALAMLDLAIQLNSLLSMDVEGIAFFVDNEKIGEIWDKAPMPLDTREEYQAALKYVQTLEYPALYYNPA